MIHFCDNTYNGCRFVCGICIYCNEPDEREKDLMLSPDFIKYLKLTADLTAWRRETYRPHVLVVETFPLKEVQKVEAKYAKKLDDIWWKLTNEEQEDMETLLGIEKITHHHRGRQ